MQKIAAQTSSLFSKRSLFILMFMAAALAACVSAPPYEEYTLAREALRAAQEADSAKYSAANWLEAEAKYRDAEQAFKWNQFGKARELFNRARSFAEKAENQTRLKKFESGDVFQ
jgi:hypothetical protein